MLVNSNLLDNVLITKIKAGDMSCFEELVNRHKDYALVLANGVLNNHEDAEEVAHDSFLKVLNSIAQFKEESKFTTWFYRIVINLAISRTRKRKLSTNTIDDMVESKTDGTETNKDIHAKDRNYYLSEAMNLLHEEERVLISLYYLKELDLTEMEEITSLNKNNLKVKMFRTRKKLAETLRKLLPKEIESIL